MIGEIANRVSLERTSQAPREERHLEKAESREARGETEEKRVEIEQKVKAEITGKGQEVDVTA